jgi:transcriptional regulator with XRE-family HTH domain
MYPNLRLELWKRRIRQNELAKRLQIDETVLSKIVNGVRRPSADLQRQIAGLLERDQSWLFEVAQMEADQPQAIRAGVPEGGARR